METVKAMSTKGAHRVYDFFRILYRDLTVHQELEATFSSLNIKVPKGTLHPLIDNVVALVRPNSVRFIDLGNKKVIKIKGEWISFSEGIAYVRLRGKVQSALTLFNVKTWEAKENQYYTSSERFLRVFTKGQARVTVSGNASRLWNGADEVKEVTVETLGRQVKGAGLYGDLVYCWRTNKEEKIDVWTTNTKHQHLKQEFSAQKQPLGTQYFFAKDDILSLTGSEDKGLKLSCYQPKNGLTLKWSDTPLEKGNGGIGNSLMGSFSGSLFNSWFKVGPITTELAGENSQYFAFAVTKSRSEAVFQTVNKMSGRLGDAFTYDPTTIGTPIQLEDLVVVWKDGKIGTLTKGDAPLNKMSAGKRLALVITGIFVTIIVTRKAIRYLRRHKDPAVAAEIAITTMEKVEPLVVATPPGEQMWAAPPRRQSAFPPGPLNDPRYYMNRATW